MDADPHEMIANDRFLLRRYDKQDLEDLLAAWSAASEIAHPFLSREFLAAERENIPSLYLPNAETWVCELDGKVAGFIALIGIEVGGLFVHPSHQRKGIGQRLLSKAKEHREELEVEVFAENSIGRAFYHKCGFELIEEKIHADSGCCLLRLRLQGWKR